jgi:hypothetical protein
MDGAFVQTFLQRDSNKYFWFQTFAVFWILYVLSTLHQAFEDGTDRGFRNVGKSQSDAGEIPKRIHTISIIYSECVCSLRYASCNARAPYCIVICGLSVCLYHIFTLYLITSRVFGRNLLDTKCVFWFSLQLSSETFLILRRIQRGIVMNVCGSSCKVPFMLFSFSWNMNLLDRRSKNSETSNFMKICPLGAKFFS